jgi:hypothetical protein
MYKIIQDNKVIDVIKHPKFVKFLSSGHMAMTDKNSAQGIVGSDNETVYSFVPIKIRNLAVVKAVEINETEFNRLSSLLNSGKEVCADEAALVKAKLEKLRALSDNCKNKIIAGFTIELSAGEQSFKLTTEDQLNLMQLENQLSSGESYFIYHATNQPCRIYTKEDILKIVKAFRKHVLYHTTYYNVAKQYITSLTDIEKINLFSYGMDVSEVVEDQVLKQVLKMGGGGQ